VAGFLVVSICSGFWFGAQLILNSNPPISFVSTNYMNIDSNHLNEWEINLFGMSLSIGDLVFIEGIDPAYVNSDYPNSDIIVFRNPDSPREHIALRVIGKEKIEGKWFFFVKGDGFGASKWPAEVNLDKYVEWNSQNMGQFPGMVSEDLVTGRVLLRVPLAGILAVLVHERFGVDDSFSAVALPVMFVFFAFVILFDFVLPALRRRLYGVQQKRQVANR
jgi:hypothetical protein